MSRSKVLSLAVGFVFVLAAGAAAQTIADETAPIDPVPPPPGFFCGHDCCALDYLMIARWDEPPCDCTCGCHKPTPWDPTTEEPTYEEMLATGDAALVAAMVALSEQTAAADQEPDDEENSWDDEWLPLLPNDPTIGQWFPPAVPGLFPGEIRVGLDGTLWQWDGSKWVPWDFDPGFHIPGPLPLPLPLPAIPPSDDFDESSTV